MGDGFEPGRVEDAQAFGPAGFDGEGFGGGALGLGASQRAGQDVGGGGGRGAPCGGFAHDQGVVGEPAPCHSDVEVLGGDVAVDDQ